MNGRGLCAGASEREITFLEDMNADLFSTITHDQEKRK